MNRNIVFSFVHLSLLLLFVLLALSCRNTADDRRMEQIISEADSLNRNYIPMTSDSLLLEACRYYDRYGTPNEQMQAHYLLGCVYRDRGEAPRAIDCYMNAIGKADTTAKDCDYREMSCVYSQMADIYYKQLLLTMDLENRKRAVYYAEKAEDWLGMAFDMKSMGATYIMLHQQDSAEIILKKSLDLYHQLGETQEEVQSSTILMSLYVDLCRFEELKQLMDRFERECQLFNEFHELSQKWRQYYYYKGSYYEGMGQLDSAEYYYRKIYYPGISYVSLDPMYRGLLSVFEKRHEADSIGKYARLFCMVNDSSIAVNDRELTARIAASYKYDSIQRKAYEKEKEANKVRMVLVILVGSIIFVVFILLSWWHRYRREQLQKQNLLKAEYAEKIEKYAQNIRTIQILEDTHKVVIQELQTELGNVMQENSSIRKRNAEIRLKQEELNARYELEKADLMEENELLKHRIDDIQQYGSITKSVEVAQSFLEEDIIRRIFFLLRSPQISLTEKEKEQLLLVTGRYYPALLQDLKWSGHVKPLATFVGILTAINLRSGDIANLLDISFQQVSNLKQQINMALFNASSARSLYSNLFKRYEIYIG